MGFIKIKRKPIRTLASITTLLLIIFGILELIYWVGVISPLTESLAFAMVFGAPSGKLDIMIPGIITLLPLWVICLIVRGLYKLLKAINKIYS